jgi:hypothetical protein
MVENKSWWGILFVSPTILVNHILKRVYGQCSQAGRTKGDRFTGPPNGKVPLPGPELETITMLFPQE